MENPVGINYRQNHSNIEMDSINHHIIYDSSSIIPTRYY